MVKGWPLRPKSYHVPPSVCNRAQEVGLKRSRVRVMYLDRIVEIVPSKELFRNARHPCTRMLLEAVSHRAARESRVEAPFRFPALIGILGKQNAGDIKNESLPMASGRVGRRVSGLDPRRDGGQHSIGGHLRPD